MAVGSLKRVVFTSVVHHPHLKTEEEEIILACTER